jgi:predicted DNA-binding transcriptional regulator AlpA
METIQFIQVTPEQLKKEILTGVKTQLDEFLKTFTPKQPNDYLSRKDVAKMFGVDISTLHNWNKSGKLKPLGLGARVYYLRSDIEQSLTPLKS